jgi:hypothetical protein
VPDARSLGPQKADRSSCPPRAARRARPGPAATPPGSRVRSPRAAARISSRPRPAAIARARRLRAPSRPGRAAGTARRGRTGRGRSRRDDGVTSAGGGGVGAGRSSIDARCARRHARSRSAACRATRRGPRCGCAGTSTANAAKDAHAATKAGTACARNARISSTTPARNVASRNRDIVADRRRSRSRGPACRSARSPYRGHLVAPGFRADMFRRQ